MKSDFIFFYFWKTFRADYHFNFILLIISNEKTIRSYSSVTVLHLVFDSKCPAAIASQIQGG